MSDLKKAIMERDGITSEEADDLINEAKIEIENRLFAGEMPYDICEEYFGLEPDYLFDLLL